MGRYSTALDYGYITVKNHKGEYIAGFPLEISYNFHTELAEFKLLKKFANPVNPEAECCRPLVINGCVLKINENDLILQ